MRNGSRKEQGPGRPAGAPHLATQKQHRKPLIVWNIGDVGSACPRRLGDMRRGQTQDPQPLIWIGALPVRMRSIYTHTRAGLATASPNPL